MVHRTINRLFQRGAEVIYNAISPVHVSGHASQEEMKFLIQLVRPQFLIPIHGELRHLKQHAALAQEIGLDSDQIAVVENGTMIKLQDGAMSIGDRVPGGYVFVDGSGVGDVGPHVLREREALARDGFVVVHLTLDCRSGKLVGEPEIVTKGFVFPRDAEELMQRARDHVYSLTKERVDGDLDSRIEEELRKFFYSETHRRPMIFAFTSEVG
jgi:ribonuclease J